MKRNNYYYLQNDVMGNVNVYYVTPCDETHLVAYIPYHERMTANPPLVWLTKACGINGIVKIASLLADPATRAMHGIIPA